MSKGREQTPSIGINFLTCQKFPKVPPWLSAVTRATSSANAWQLQSLRASSIGADGPASLEHRLAFCNSTESSDPGIYNYGKHHPLDLVLCGVALLCQGERTVPVSKAVTQSCPFAFDNFSWALGIISVLLLFFKASKPQNLKVKLECLHLQLLPDVWSG